VTGAQRHHIETVRLNLDRFAIVDAEVLFSCITPAVTRFMAWDPPPYAEFRSRCEALSRGEEEIQFVIRRRDTLECLGVAGVERPADELPELGVWLKEAAQGQGYGREAVEAVARWASEYWSKTAFLYPVAVENLASRRIAERLGGEIIATRSGPKYNSVVYRIPARA
jgi:RimJ/RimL family protein N-acetyltransferase